MTPHRLYPAPYAPIHNDSLGKDGNIFDAPWTIKHIRTKPSEAGKPLRKSQYEFGIYAKEICVAVLAPGQSLQVIEWVLAAMNNVAHLRGMWDLLSAEQIPLAHGHMEGLLSAYRRFFKSEAVEIKRAKTSLRDMPAWVDTVDTFLKAAAKRRPKSLTGSAFVGAWGYEPFWNIDGTPKTVSRIYCRDEAGKKHTLLVMSGYDPDCPQAKKLHGETVVATVHAFLSLNPSNPTLAWKFFVAVTAIRQVLPELRSTLETVHITAHARPELFEFLGVMKMHCEGLQGCFDIWNSPKNRIEPVLWANAEERQHYYKRNRERLADVDHTKTGIPEAEEKAARAFGVRAPVQQLTLPFFR